MFKYRDMKEFQFRSPSETELRILQRLLELPFYGCTQLLQQLHGLRVKRLDQDGSLQLEVTSEARTPYNGLAVEARCPDFGTLYQTDPHINLLLHLRHGKMWMLEIYRDDSLPIKAEPDGRRTKRAIPRLSEAFGTGLVWGSTESNVSRRYGF